MYDIVKKEMKGVLPKDVRMVSGELFFDDIELKGVYGKYKATFPNREHLVIYDKETDAVKSAIFIMTGQRGGVKTENVSYYGELHPKYLYLLGMTEDKTEYKFVMDERPKKGLSNKIKGLSYSPLNKISTGITLQGSIEESLYENVPIEELLFDKDMSWLEKKDYRVLTKREDILEWIEGLDKTEEIVGFDTETSGLLVNRTLRDILVGLCMSYEDNAGIYIPIKHLRMKNSEIEEKELLELLKPYFDSHSPSKKKVVGHNLKFDWKVMKMHGWELEITDDTFVRQGILNISSAKAVATLKGIAQKVLNIDVIEIQDMYKKVSPKMMEQYKDLILNKGAKVNDITRYKFQSGAKKFEEDMVDFRFASEDFVNIYGCADGDFPRLILKEMWREQGIWDEEKEVYPSRTNEATWTQGFENIYRMELGLLPMVAEQEYYGIRVDRDKFEELGKITDVKIKRLEKKIYEEAGQEFNIKSAPQKTEIIFEKLKVPKKARYRTKKGSYSTGASVLDDIASYKTNGKPRYPIAEYLRKYSKLEKLNSSFYKSLPKLVTDSYIFPNYNTIRAETGRLSCNKPNIQQTEPTSRKYMIPDSEEYYFLVCDFSQVEYRLMAGLSGETKVINFFKENPEADYHILAYANMKKKRYEDVTSKERKEGKKINFGVSYGLEDANMALSLYGDDAPILQKMAHQARKDYLDGVPVIRDYFEAVRDKAEIDGYTQTKFGRRRQVKEFLDKRTGKVIPSNRLSEYMRAKGRRVAGNMAVQGTAADIMKMAMIRLRDTFRRYGFYEDMARACLNVHDEVCYQIHKSIHPWLATAIMREAMEINFDSFGFPPLYVGANVGYNWKDGKADELEAPVLLMDRECKKAMDLFVSEYPEIKEGKSLKRFEGSLPEIAGLERLEDPRGFWADEITRFAMEVIEEEINRGNPIKEDSEEGEIIVGYLPIKNYKDARKNVRINKYSNHFEEYSNLVVMEILENRENKDFYEELYTNWNKYKRYESTYAIKLENEIEQIIKEKNYTTMEDVLSDNEIYSKIIYFGDKGSVGNYGYLLLESKLLKGEEAFDWREVYRKNSELKGKLSYTEDKVSEVRDFIEKEGINEVDDFYQYPSWVNPFENSLGDYARGYLENVLNTSENIGEEIEKDLVKGKEIVEVSDKESISIEEKRVVLKQELLKCITYDKEDNILHVKPLYEDMKLFQLLDKLVEEGSSIFFDSRVEGGFSRKNRMTLKVWFPNGEYYIKNGWFLPAERLKVLKRALAVHVAYMDNQELLNYAIFLQGIEAEREKMKIQENAS